MPLLFSQLDESRVDEAFSVLQRVGRHIEAKGRRQRISNTTRGTYCEWQAEHANYVVTAELNGPIVGLVTLRNERLDDWPEFAPTGSVPMLRALATHPEHHGEGIGEFAVRQAIALCTTGTTIYLDCVSDFLPEYYGKLGFKVVAQQVRGDGHDEQYDITLMTYCH